MSTDPGGASVNGQTATDSKRSLLVSCIPQLGILHDSQLSFVKLIESEMKRTQSLQSSPIP
jgi:hypothetical protein